MHSYKILNGGTTTKFSRIPWQTSVMCFYFILALMKIASCEAMPSIKKFFPSARYDLTKVTWTDYVYDDETLQRELEDKMMMIISGVTLEKIKEAGLGKKAIWSPIMSFIINMMPTMSLKHFLKKVADAKSSGVRLNFDRIDVFEESIKVLKAMGGELKFPLWLHAVTDNMEESDIDKFLSLCTHNFPEATISIGMLHKGQTLDTDEMYTEKLVTQMKDTLTRNNVTQSVAFPVDMDSALLSLDTLPALKDVPGITDSALYIYMRNPRLYSYDELSMMRKLIKKIGKNRVYLNVIEAVHKKII